jgi:SAM-dependent methyltransferase
MYTAVREIPDALYDQVYASNAGYRLLSHAADRTAAGEWGFRQLWWFKRMALKWLEGATSGRRLVDIGCGPGTFLLVARSRGWDVAGVELAREAAAQAARYGLEVHQGSVESFAENNVKRFDAAVCFEVLEHVTDPIGMLRAIHRLLSDKGILVISVPNRDDPYCLKQRIQAAMPPVHINFFNRQSLGIALARAGFEVTRFKSLPIPTSSVRNVHGKQGFWMRVPGLLLERLRGRADGTTLIALARRRDP